MAILGLPATEVSSRMRTHTRVALALSIGLATGSSLAGEEITFPDPLRLPAATARQKPRLVPYRRRGVPSRRAGAWYRDPTTGVRIYKLTSATFPVPAPGWGHDYAEGGDEVSLPYDGATRSVLVRQNGGPHWLIEFRPDVPAGNPRPLTGDLAPFMDLAFTFSSNPATPYFAYVSNGSAIVRFDVRTMAEVPGGGWPQAETAASWLHQSENDGMFVWMRAFEATIVAFEPATNTKKTYIDVNVDEPRIDRAGRYVGLSMGVPANGLVVWDWDTASPVWSTPGDPGIPFAHGACLRRRWIVSDWNTPIPNEFGMFIPDVPDSGMHIGGTSVSNTVHANGSWLQHPTQLDDQWALFSHYGSLEPPRTPWRSRGWTSPGGMVLMTPNGQRRLLAHSYNTTSEYNFHTFAKFSSDGRYVQFTSDMNGSGRSDVFLAELPLTTAPADPNPPVASLTGPAAGATVSRVVVVSATAFDDVGIAAVQFKLDGINLGAEDTSAPFTVSWRTRRSANGPHVLTAVAWDAAGNAAVSDPVPVTVDNSRGSN